MEGPTILVAAIVGAIFVAIVVRMIVNKKNEKNKKFCISKTP